MRQLNFVSVLAERLSAFVTFRRLSGINPRNPERDLEYFDRFLFKEGFRGAWPTQDSVERYLASMQRLHPGTRCNRLSAVRQFCRFLRQVEPECYVPGQLLRWGARPRRAPHIFPELEIQAILRAVRSFSPPGCLRSKTYYTLFGVLYTTGLRCGEAFALNLGDADLDDNVLQIRRGKFGKSRLVPISPSTSLALRDYVQERSRVAPAERDDPLFITSTGCRVYHTNADLAFRQALRLCGLRGGKGSPGPRLHDIRHTFACERMLRWYREGRDVNSLVAYLVTYLGHVNVTSTQVYLHGTAELLEKANERFHRKFLEDIQGKEKEYDR